MLGLILFTRSFIELTTVSKPVDKVIIPPDSGYLLSPIFKREV